MSRQCALGGFMCFVGWIVVSLALAVLLLWLSLGTMRAETAVATDTADFGYGFNVAAWDVDRLQNMSFNWMKVFNAPGSLAPTLINPNDTISPSETVYMTVSLASSGQPTGAYTASLTIDTAPDTVGAPTTIPINLFIVDQIYHTYLPLVERP